jgi:hypothetical protein
MRLRLGANNGSTNVLADDRIKVSLVDEREHRTMAGKYCEPSGMLLVYTGRSSCHLLVHSGPCSKQDTGEGAVSLKAICARCSSSGDTAAAKAFKGLMIGKRIYGETANVRDGSKC